jgi:hypothetical protein
MAVRIVPYTEREEPAAQAFNQRMRERNAASEFLLPERAPQLPAGQAIPAFYHLALDGDFCRGGLVLSDYAAWLSGQEVTAVNCIAPLSEGIVDPKHTFVAMQIVKAIQQRSPYAFSVGMGNANNPYPRLLKAAGWTILPVPFFFRMCRPNRVLRELRVIQNTPLRGIVSKIAATTGLAAVAIGALQARSRARPLEIESSPHWGDWADMLWIQFREKCAFAVNRDSKNLREMYPASDPKLIRFLLRRDGEPVAWAAALNTAMQDDKYFGNLRVATILDCVATTREMTAAITTVAAALAHEGADLVISNQSHSAWQRAFRGAGFLLGPSNYLVGVSKAIASAIPDRSGEIHITRGDGDGRVHL